MKYLKIYEDMDHIRTICNDFDIRNFIINQDGTISTRSHVDLSNRNFSKLPLNFNRVNGFFDCENNHLKSLKGCPEYVDGYFDCSFNKLTSLKNCPIRINGSFWASHNELTSLKGGPQFIAGNYYCTHNNLIDVKGFPENFSGKVFIYPNPVYGLIQLINEHPNGGSQKMQVKFIKYLNEFNVIQGTRIFEEGLRQAFYMTTKRELVLTEEFIPNYTLF